MLRLITCLIALMAPLALSAQTDSDREGVRQAILDYVEGIYDRDPSRIERSVHPTLAKRGYMVPRDSAVYREGAMTYDRLLEVAQNFNRTGWIPAHAPKHIEVYEVLDQTASAKLTAVWGIDYFHLAKYDGRWQIANVLWQSPPEEHPQWRAQASPAVDNDLAPLSDEFDGGLQGWRQHHEVEGWSNKLKRMAVDSGLLRLEPHTSVWFYDYTAPFLFREVEGDFMVTTRMRVRGTRHEYPQSTYSLAGLMLRRPRADAPYRADSAWAKDREDYVFAVTGTTDRAGVPILETKSAVRSRPMVKHYPLDRADWLELRLARIGPTILVLYRHDGGEWQLHERFFRPDLPRALQAGMMAYSDFATIDRAHWYRPWEYNTKVITDGNADLAASFDWIHFERIAVPDHANGWLESVRADSWSDFRADNDGVLRALPFLRSTASPASAQNEPELVQPGTISGARNETFPSIDPVDGSLWFSVYDQNFDRQTLMRAARRGEAWLAPEAVSFSGQWGDRAPRFAPDGRTLYFTSNRPVTAGGAAGNMQLWRVQRTAGGWGAPARVAIDVAPRVMHATVTRSGELYFAATKPGERADVYALAGTGAPRNLGAPINDALGQPDVLVSPDGTWMILVITDDPRGLGGDDLFLSRNVNGKWTAPEALGAPINSAEYEYGPSLSPDGRWLYYTSHRRGGNGDVYRVPLSAVMKR